MNKYERIANKHGVKYIDKGNGHIQFKGDSLIVNYYPESKRKTAYIAGMKGSLAGVSADKAAQMAFQIPVQNGIKDVRKKNYKGAKNILLAKDPHCHWCGIDLIKETATLDHVIPLSRGGINNMNNYVLACSPCNQERGNSMPELIKDMK
jgi:hypothetical protein